MNEATIYVLKKMCSYVDADYDKIDFQEHNWYYKYTWSTIDEENFIDWLTYEVQKNNDVRKGLTSLPYRPGKKMARKFADHFNFMFGWKVKNNE